MPCSMLDARCNAQALFDQWWERARKPLDSYLTIPADPHEAVMSLSEAERRDRVRVIETAALPKQ
jgi:hypothetical protein